MIKSTFTNVEKLKIEYSKIFLNKENQPSWAVKKKNIDELVYPSIPFVGNDYDKTKIFLYASAENLANYCGWLDENKIASNRHRTWFEEKSDNCFFPKVHINPLNNGGLVNIVGYVAMKLSPDFQFKTPRELLEGVAFANFGKFSISDDRNNKNIDYAGNYKKLSDSIEYIKADLVFLKPKVVIIPDTIYKHPRIKAFFQSLFPEIKIIPIYQIHHFNINGKNRLKKYKKKDNNEIGILAEWQKEFGKGLTGKTNENFYSFYTYLDYKIE